MSGRPGFPVRLVTPEGVTFDGDAQEVIVSGKGGELGILARHAPIVADLQMGSCRIQLPENDSWKVWATAEGFAKAHDSTATILVEEALELSELEVDSYKEKLANAEERLAAAKAASSTEEDDVYRRDVVAVERDIAWYQHVIHLLEDSTNN